MMMTIKSCVSDLVITEHEGGEVLLLFTRARQKYSYYDRVTLIL